MKEEAERNNISQASINGSSNCEVEPLRNKLKETMLIKAVDNRLSCAEAFHIAEEYGTTYAEVGAAADESGIRIVSCRLGCF